MSADTLDDVLLSMATRRLLVEDGASFDDDRVQRGVQQAWTFGRDSGCDVVATDPLVSPRHLRVIRLVDTTVLVQDLGSVNGTTVITSSGGSFKLGFGRPTTVARIQRGDLVIIGMSRITWHR